MLQMWGLFILSILLFCTTGITLPRPDSSLPCSFSPQGLLCPAWIHPYLALLLHRDDFRRSDASLSCSFAPQRLFPPVGCISILLFCSTGIISAARMHLYLALLLHRDYFRRPYASLSCSFAPQGLFPPVGFIPTLLFFTTGIISAARMHLYLALLLHKDYFRRPNASLSCSFLPQGWFRPGQMRLIAENISDRPFRQLPI